MFKPGIEVFFSQKHAHRALPVAAVTNHTGRDRDGRHLVNLLSENPCFDLKKIFTPEHGFTSDAPDGEHVADSRLGGTPIISLYGPNKKPAAEMLKDVKLLIYDIQDLGVRFYTYISTLANILEAANENGISVLVLDRPDVLGGLTVEGPMRQKGFESFVSHLPIPLRYGLTAGELAKWLHGTNKYSNDLEVCCCEDYSCPAEFNDLGFPWFKPSPSMPDIKSALLYPGTCLFEGTNISEGRGTDSPFRTLGAPFVDSDKWLEALKPLLPETVSVEKTSFIPTFSKFEGQKCFGITLNTEKIIQDSVYVGISALYALMESHPGKVDFTDRPNLKHPFIDYLAGTDQVRKALLSGSKPSEIVTSVSDGVDSFSKDRSRFFLYPRNSADLR